MLRMTGGIAFNIIDVRSAEAFKQSNISFSVNIPAETFAQNLNDRPHWPNCSARRA